MEALLDVRLASGNGYFSLKSQTVNPPVVDGCFYTSSCAPPTDVWK